MSFLLDASSWVFLLIVLGGLAVLVIAWVWIAGLFAPNAPAPSSTVLDTNMPPKPNTSATLPPALTTMSPASTWAGERRAASTFAAATPTTAASFSVPARKAETVELFGAESPQAALHGSAAMPEQTQATGAPSPDAAPLVIHEPNSMVAASSNPTALSTMEMPQSTAPKLFPWQQRTPAPLRRRPPLGEQTIRLLRLG